MALVRPRRERINRTYKMIHLEKVIRQNLSSHLHMRKTLATTLKGNLRRTEPRRD